jgi:uncharacterized protein YjaG (DUF416 family)
MPEPLFGNEKPRLFNEQRVMARLSSLSARGRSVFAFSCSRRLFPGYLKWNNEILSKPDSRVEEVLSLAARELRNSSEDALFPSLASEVEPLLDLMPTEDSTWSQALPVAEDAVACLAYTLRAMIGGDPQEAAWSARRAYEAADQLAILDLRKGTSEMPDESDLRAHPAVQAELARQEADFALIAQGETAKVLDAVSVSSVFDF